TAKERPQQGKVVAVGPGRVNEEGKRLEMTVKEGDRVVYSKYAGTEGVIDGDEYLIMSEGDILAIMQEEAPPAARRGQEGAVSTARCRTSAGIARPIAHDIETTLTQGR